MTPGANTIAFVSWPTAPLTDSLVRKSLASIKYPPRIVEALPTPAENARIIQWSTYDAIDHTLTKTSREAFLSSSYTFRKALIRKHFLSRTTQVYIKKNSNLDSARILEQGLPRTWEIELSFADELDEMWTDELYDLGAEMDGSEKRWWILKPAMADRGMGIRLFDGRKALQKIFEEFEEQDDEVEEESDTVVLTSQLRHFVIQEYLSSTVLIDPNEVPNSDVGSLKGHKFHLRVYAFASGALTLYLYPRILALFAPTAYDLPDSQSDNVDLSPHLTNTSLQTELGEKYVRLFDELIGSHMLPNGNTSLSRKLTDADVQDIIGECSTVLAETFKAALGSPIHFQTEPNAFELFGVDFLVTYKDAGAAGSPFQVKLLELNSEPAIELTGPKLTWILEDLFKAIGIVCVQPFCALEKDADLGGWSVGERRHGLIKALDVQVRGEGGW